LTLAARLEVVALDLLLARTPAPAAAAPASEGDVSAMKAALQADFQTADLQWAQWRAFRAPFATAWLCRRTQR